MSDDAAVKKYIKMTQTPIKKLVIMMSIPTIISMLVTSLYNMADTYFVGQIGTSATGAVGVAYSVMIVIQALGYTFGNGAGNYLSRALGRQENKKASQAASTAILTNFAVALILALIGIAILDPLVYFLGATETIAPYAKEYLFIILLGMPFACTSFCLNVLLRYQGNAMYAMIGIMAGGIINVGLDPLFISVFDMGVKGAALATVIGQFISFVILFIQNERAGVLKLNLKNVVIKLRFYVDIIRDGLPTFYRQVLISVSVVLLNSAARDFGDPAIAALSIVSRLSIIGTCILFGFGQGFQPVCGFNYGAKNYKRVMSAFWFCLKITTGILIIIGALGYIFAPSLIGIFRDDPEVIEIGIKALQYNMLVLPLAAGNVLVTMITQTTGRLFRSTLLALCRQGICYAPCVLILPHLFGITGLQMVQACAELLALLVAVPVGYSVIREITLLGRENAEEKLKTDESKICL